LKSNIKGESLVSKGIGLYTIGKFKEAISLYKKAIPFLNFNDKGLVYYNIGLCYFSMMDYENSERLFKNSFYDFGNKMSGYELSMSYLFNGKLELGLKSYKFRYFGSRNSFPPLNIKHIDNISDCLGKKVLVLNEQGFGDEFLFSRCIPKLSEISTDISYQSYEEIIDLFKENFTYPNVNFFSDRILSRDFVNNFDVWISTGDLFSSYVLEFGQNKFKSIGNIEQRDVKNIGISWEANKLSKNSNKRSIESDILNFSDKFSIHNLQRGYSLSWAKNYDIKTFSDTYNIIKDLDLVITVDTSIAHLSGLMNKRTILVYNEYLDWRWKYNFYDTIEIVKISDLSNHKIFG